MQMGQSQKKIPISFFQDPARGTHSNVFIKCFWTRKLSVSYPYLCKFFQWFARFIRLGSNRPQICDRSKLEFWTLRNGVFTLWIDSDYPVCLHLVGFEPLVAFCLQTQALYLFSQTLQAGRHNQRIILLRPFLNHSLHHRKHLSHVQPSPEGVRLLDLLEYNIKLSWEFCNLISNHK